MKSSASEQGLKLIKLCSFTAYLTAFNNCCQRLIKPGDFYLGFSETQR